MEFFFNALIQQAEATYNPGLATIKLADVVKPFEMDFYVTPVGLLARMKLHTTKDDADREREYGERVLDMVSKVAEYIMFRTEPEKIAVSLEFPDGSWVRLQAPETAFKAKEKGESFSEEDEAMAKAEMEKLLVKLQPGEFGPN